MCCGTVAHTGMEPFGLVAALAFLWIPLGGAAQSGPALTGTDPTPVLLVPGWGAAAAEVRPLRDRLRDAGWPSTHLSIATFSDSFGSNEEHSAEIGEAIEVLARRTGSRQVDIVAHSMGGLAVRHFLEQQPSPAVRRVIFLGTPHRGTVVAVLAWGEGAREMEPGSEFLERLNQAPATWNDVEMLAIRSPLDLLVIPGSSAILPGARNEEVCCPTHQGLLDDPEAFRRIRQFLTASDS